MKRDQLKSYKFLADLRASGYVTCRPEDFQDAVEQAITDGEFEYAMGSMDWIEVDLD